MTHEEIVKANDILDRFDFFNQPAGYEHWMGLPEGIKDRHFEDKANDIKFLKDFINRQQAEIKRLESKVNRLKKYDEERDIALHARLIATSRAEGIKEFAEKLISRAHYICVGNRVGSRHNLVDTKTIVDTYLEMVGGHNV